MINFYLGHPYQLTLFTGLVEVMKGILYLDTTFDLGGKFIVTSVMEHPMLLNRETGGPAQFQVELVISLDGIRVLLLYFVFECIRT